MKKLLSILTVALLCAFTVVPGHAAPSMDTPNLKTMKQAIDSLVDAYVKVMKNPNTEAYKNFKEHYDMCIGLPYFMELSNEERAALAAYKEEKSKQVKTSSIFDFTIRSIIFHIR